MAIQLDRLLIALLVTLGVGAAIGFAGGIIGMLFFAIAEVAAEAFYSSTLAAIIGFALCLIPTIVGVVYLMNGIDRREYEHCAILGLLIVLVSLVFIPFMDEPTTWPDVLFYLTQIPVALAGCWYLKRMTDAK